MQNDNKDLQQETVKFCTHKRKFINNNFYAALEEMAQRTRDWLNSDQDGYLDSEVEAVYEANAFRLQNVINFQCKHCNPTNPKADE